MTFELEILVPDETIARAQVDSLRAADASGRFGLWPNHEPFLTMLEPCILEFREARGVTRYAAVDGGVLLMENERASVVTREAVVADHLDQVADAAASMLAARRAAEKGARAEFAELQASLVRQLRHVEKTR